VAEPEDLARKLIDRILEGRIVDRRGLEEEKRKLCKELGLPGIPSLPFILSHATAQEREDLLPLLQLKPSRTASGVAVVAVQTSPSQTCPGSCVFCPDFPLASKSYTGNEPASMRAIQCDYDPGLQVSSRLEQLSAMGHSTSKVELIVQGATFPAMDLEYRRWFMARCLDAISGHVEPGTLGCSISRAENSASRPVGITFETRPDWCSVDIVEAMLALGGTRVEIGVQTLSEEVYRATGRGHSVAQVAQAFESSRGRGMKVCAHMMMGLPGSDESTDLESFRRLFTDPGYSPDELKIYPTLVIEGTELHGMWKKGEYEPLTDDQVADLLVKVKEMVPPWVRIKRVMRDIPSKMIAAGPRSSDMRSRVQDRMRSSGSVCRCIRCREVSRAWRAPGNVIPVERSYRVTGGNEIFLSYEDERETLAAFLRLSVRDDGSCHVRELHTYGRAVDIGQEPSRDDYQHRGLGRSLLSIAEEKAIDRGSEVLKITSGIGTRGYYRKLGYILGEPYMVKLLASSRSG
jgi:elongator complex protein 3